MIKDFFNKHTPIDKTVLGRFGRYVLVRGSCSGSRGAECKYGLYIPGQELVPVGDVGVVLDAEELRQLAALLPDLIASGKVRDFTPPQEFQAALEAQKQEGRKPLW